MSQPLKNVIIIGAGGNLGSAVFEALTKASGFTVSVVSRKSSKSHFPSHIQVHTVGDDYPEPELVEAFKGQDVVISAVMGLAVPAQKGFIAAAIKAGVKRFLPSEFGSDTWHSKGWELLPAVGAKRAIIEQLRNSEQSGLTWTAICNGLFFDRGIKTGFLGFDLSAHKATIYNSGDARWTTSTLARVGAAVVETLANSDKTANRFVHVGSFTTSQNEVLAALEKASGETWTVEHATTEDAIKLGKEKQSKGDRSAVVPLFLAYVYAEGNGNDYEEQGRMANDLLGLPEQHLQEVIAGLVKGA